MTDPDEMSDRELAALAKEVADRLERRGVVAGAGGIAAGGVLGWLASGEARAGSQSVGQIGTSSSPVDVEAEDINGETLTSEDAASTKIRNGRFVVDASDPGGILSGSNIVQKINDAFTVIQNLSGDQPGRVVVPRANSFNYSGGTDTITIPRFGNKQGAELIGHGRPEIRWGGTSNKLIELPPGTPGQDNLRIEGLHLTSASTASIPVALDLHDCTLSRITDVKFGMSGRVTDAVVQIAGENSTANKNTVERCFIKPGESNGVVGVRIGPSGANDISPLNSLVDCEVNGVTAVQFGPTSSTQNEILRGSISNATTGVLIEGDTSFVRTRFEGGFGPGANIETPVDFQGDGNVVRTQKASSQDISDFCTFAGSDNSLIQPGTTDIPRPTDGDTDLNLHDADVLTISDDAVGTFGFTSGLCMVYDTNNGVTYGLFMMAFNDISGSGASSNMSNQGARQLSGTTGPDGSLNIAVDGATVYLENRTGAQETFGAYRIGDPS